MNNNGTTNSEIVFTLYPDPASAEKINFSSQYVVKPGYFPQVIQDLIDKINASETRIEAENAVDNLTSYITNQKRDFMAMYEKSKLRESINQRKFFVFVNEDNDPLVNDATGNIIYIAGPIGGGIPRLTHDLLLVQPDQNKYLVQFDDKEVAHQIDKVIATSSRTNKDCERIEIIDDGNNFEGFVNRPIVCDEVEYKLSSAAQYFEGKYHQISSILDFSPLLDSGMTAASALIKANLIYFEDFPDILKDKLNQYKKDDLSSFDFLGIQKIAKSQRSEKLTIAGFRFMDNGKEFNCVLDELFKGLKVFILSENSIFTIRNKIKQLKTDSELSFEIDEYISKRTADSGKSINTFEGRQSASLRDMIGPEALKQSMKVNDSKPIRVPVGFFQFRKATKLRLETTFTQDELPTEYYPIIESFGNALKFLENGPLRILKYFPSESSLYLSLGEYMFEICRQQPEHLSDEMMTIYYLAKDDEIIQKMFEIRDKPIEPWMEYFFEPGLSLNYSMVYNRYEQYGNPESYAINQADTVRIVQSKKPVSMFAERLLKDYMVPIQLKRVLAEINDWEEGLLIHFDTSQIPLISHENDTLTHQMSPNWAEKMTSEGYLTGEKDKQIQIQLNKLEKEIDAFNPGFYSFLVGLLQRERSDEVNTTESLYSTIKNIYQDMKVALVDFGLSPVEWVHAMELQMWTTYQSQLNYMKHSLTMILGELLGIDYTGEDLDLIKNYSKLNQPNYSSFEGMIMGDKYVMYKKAYLFFDEKIDEFKEELQGMTSLMELISKLEATEVAAREKNRANLPKLPTMRS